MRFLHLLPLCITVVTFSAWDNCFDRIPNRTLIGSSIVIKEDISLARCQNACLEMAGERCRSITYSEIDGRCELNKGDHETNPRIRFPIVGWVDYYIRLCYDKPSVALLRDEAQFEESCFQAIPGKILIGIVDELIQDVSSQEDCRKACQKRQGSGVICKSAAYSSKEKECIIASQSRKDIPDLFIDDDKYVYIENTCLEGSGKESEVKKIVPNKKPSTKSIVNENRLNGGLDIMGTLPKPSKSSMKEYLWNKKPSGVRKSPHVSFEPSGYDFGIIGESAEDITAPTTTTTTTITTPYKRLEQSGYESNSEGINGGGAMEEITTQKPVATLPAKIIDNYAIEATPKSTSYGRRLRDDRVRTCFQEVRPLYAMIESRVAKAYSLEQCTDICRLCFHCLRGKKCRSVAYDRSKELCALSITPMIDGGTDDSSVIFHNRLEATACNIFPFRSRKY